MRYSILALADSDQNESDKESTEKILDKLTSDGLIKDGEYRTGHTKVIYLDFAKSEQGSSKTINLNIVINFTKLTYVCGFCINVLTYVDFVIFFYAINSEFQDFVIKMLLPFLSHNFLFF